MGCLVAVFLALPGVLFEPVQAQTTNQAEIKTQAQTKLQQLKLSASGIPTRPLRILTKPIEPFVVSKDGSFSGFSIDLWQLIAQRQGWDYEMVLVPTLADLLAGMKSGQADVAIAAVTITAEREQYIDFSHPYFRSGLAILTNNETTNTLVQAVAVLRVMLFSSAFAWAAFYLIVVLLLVSHTIWFLERRNNPEFSKNYVEGIWDSFWWAMVTITTVGYGDKAPRAILGKLFAMLWMLIGYFMFAYFTAAVTSSVTINELRGSINGPDDLPGQKVGVVKKSTSHIYVTRRGNSANAVPVDRIEQAISMLKKGEVKAVVHDAPVLLYYAANKGQGKVRVAGPIFHKEDYGIVLPNASPLRKTINRSILSIVETGDYAKLYAKWFGPSRAR